MNNDSTSNTFILIIGVCNEWPDLRNEIGDIALNVRYRQLLSSSLENILHIKDKEATNDNCTKSLEEPLEKAIEANQPKVIDSYFILELWHIYWPMFMQ